MCIEGLKQKNRIILLFSSSNRTAVLDGINLEIQSGDPSHFVDFVRELRRLMDNGHVVNNQKEFLITANPSCVHPSYVLGESLYRDVWAATSK